MNGTVRTRYALLAHTRRLKEGPFGPSTVKFGYILFADNGRDAQRKFEELGWKKNGFSVGEDFVSPDEITEIHGPDDIGRAVEKTLSD